jgi:hypothetical protein
MSLTSSHRRDELAAVKQVMARSNRAGVDMGEGILMMMIGVCKVSFQSGAPRIFRCPNAEEIAKAVFCLRKRHSRVPHGSSLNRALIQDKAEAHLHGQYWTSDAEKARFPARDQSRPKAISQL